MSQEEGACEPGGGGVGAVSQEAPTEPEVQTQGVLSPQVSFSRDTEGGGVGGRERD